MRSGWLCAGIVMALAGFLPGDLIAGPYIVAHRGASGDAPENTLPAFELAWKQGADAIEGDFHLTRDGRIVCIHDADTQRVAGEKLVVRESTFEQLRKLDVGRWKDPKFAGTTIPTLGEVLALVPPGKKIFVEVKTDAGIVPALLAELRQSALKPEQVVIISFQADVIAKVRKNQPQYKANWLTSFKIDDQGVVQPTLEKMLTTLRETHATGLGSNFKHVDASLVRLLEDAGFEYHVWTVDVPEVAGQFVDWKARSITTNLPGMMRPVVDRPGR